MLTILIDFDEIAYKSSAHSSVWCKGMSLFRTKKQCLLGTTEGEIYRQSISPLRRTIFTQVRSMLSNSIEKVKERYPREDINVVIVGSGTGNYRKDVFPAYKANRNPDNVPFNLSYAKSLAKDMGYPFLSVDGVESDDVLGYLQEPYSSIIVSSDKDFLTVPGLIYNPMKDSFMKITSLEADRNLFMQALVGDRADNIPGVFGIGPVKALKILKDSQTRQEMYEVVMASYKKCITYEFPREAFHMSLFLLYIQRHQHSPRTVEKWVEWFLGEEDNV